ncbi:MAG TPA: ATP-binding protein [Xanthobacteraceae bacterium]|jgi:signal transduction histidine kinase
MAFSLKDLWGARRRLTIRGTLVGMVVGCVLPAWIGMALLILAIYKGDRDRAIQNTIMTAHALVLAVDRDLAIVRTGMEVLATSPQLAADDLAGFHKTASALSQQLPGNNIVLHDPFGRQLVNTLVPFGEPLPMQGTRKRIDQVFVTGRPVISDLFMGPVAKFPLVAVDVPVWVDGVVKYGLAISLFPERLREILDRQNLPPDWIASIYDASGVVVARTRNPERYVGHPGAAVVTAAIARDVNGVVEASPRDGVPVYAAFSRSEVSNWAVAIGVPAAEINQGLYVFLGLSGAGALLLLGIGIGFSGYHANRIASAMRALVAPAMAFGRGETPRIPRLPIHEVDEVAQALDRAFHVLERRTIERDHAEREKQIAESTARLKDEFIGTVSHELRTPLTSIAAALALLNGGADVDSSDPKQRLLAIAHDNSQRLVRLVNDILDIEKLEAGKVAFDLEAVDITSLLDRALEADRPLAESCGVKLRREGAASLDVPADPDRLMQVFSNLLSNAIAFSPRDAEVVVAIQDRGGRVRFSVTDRGPGVPESFKPRLFEKFAQADSSDGRKRSGTGLGLSIVQQIVTRLGGAVGYADVPGGGAAFIVDLPGLQRGASAGVKVHEPSRKTERIAAA